MPELVNGSSKNMLTPGSQPWFHGFILFLLYEQQILFNTVKF